MQSTIVNVTNLSKSFGKESVLHNIDFEIHRGDFVAIKGPSGSGKSTLLSIIGLLENYSSGKVSLFGDDVSTFSEQKKSTFRNKKIGWIFQNFNLIGDMTISDNITLPLKYAKSKNDTKIIVSKALENVGLAAKANSYPAQLSGGQQQRVAIARALITSPDLILADEPTGSLDSANGEKVMSLLRELNKQGKTVLMITHDDEIAQQANRIITITDGCVQKQ